MHLTIGSGTVYIRPDQCHRFTEIDIDLDHEKRILLERAGHSTRGYMRNLHIGTQTLLLSENVSTVQIQIEDMCVRVWTRARPTCCTGPHFYIVFLYLYLLPLHTTLKVVNSLSSCFLFAPVGFSDIKTIANITTIFGRLLHSTVKLIVIHAPLTKSCCLVLLNRPCFLCQFFMTPSMTHYTTYCFMIITPNKTLDLAGYLWKLFQLSLIPIRTHFSCQHRL